MGSWPTIRFCAPSRLGQHLESMAEYLSYQYNTTVVDCVSGVEKQVFHRSRRFSVEGTIIIIIIITVGDVMDGISSTCFCMRF